MSPPRHRVVIAGACAAGLSAAQTLREEGFAGDIVMVGDETGRGYDRPPLSKQMLMGSMQGAELALRPDSFYAEMRIELLDGRTATRLDLAQRAIYLDDGVQLAFDGLIIATGLRPKTLRQPSPEGVFTLRTLDDAFRLREYLEQATQVLVVGAGFLGCEVAASARHMGCETVLVDKLPLPMLRQLGPELAQSVARLHSGNGVDVRCGTSIQRLLEQDGRVSGAVLADGRTVQAQAVVVAIGSSPATQWLEGSGLDLHNGVMCDEYCRAAEGVFAAGDVANFFSRRFQTRMRLEHRMNATEQGMAAAQNLLGANMPFDPLPYFWTDQYDVKIQGFGCITPDARLATLAGQAGQTGFVGAYECNGRVSAVVAWNAAREVRKYRGWVGRGLHEPAGA